jgi:hypothetical protein
MGTIVVLHPTGYYHNSAQFLNVYYHMSFEDCTFSGAGVAATPQCMLSTMLFLMMVGS